MTESFGHVVTDPEDGGFLGAEVGSNTAELSATAHSEVGCSGEGVEAAIVRSDSTYALNIASGTWEAKANRELARRVSSLWREVSGLIILSGEHVPAHTGHRWNERADHLAFRAMKGESPLPLQFWKPEEVVYSSFKGR